MVVVDKVIGSGRKRCFGTWRVEMWSVLNRSKIVTHLFLHISSKAGTTELPFPVPYRL